MYSVITTTTFVSLISDGETEAQKAQVVERISSLSALWWFELCGGFTAEGKKSRIS